jgi:hypothetical protein
MIRSRKRIPSLRVARQIARKIQVSMDELTDYLLSP